MDILELIILLVLAFGGSIVKLFSKKKEDDGADVVSSEETPNTWYEEVFSELKDEAQEVFEELEDDFLPRAKTSDSTPTSATEQIKGATERFGAAEQRNSTRETLNGTIQDSCMSPSGKPSLEGESSLQDRDILSSSLEVKKSTLEVKKSSLVTKETDNAHFGDEIEENDINILDELSDAEEMRKAVIYHEILSTKF